MKAPKAIVSVEIEKLVYGGDGLARLPADAAGRRMAVFVPFTLPGETVEVALETTKGTFARGELQRVLVASAQRESPACPYFGRCGGCHLQHGSYELQLESKVAVLRETLARAVDLPALEIAAMDGSPWRYRNRIRLHSARHPGFRLGYLERRSHQLLDIEECPIAAEILERTLVALSQGRLAALVPDEVTEIELFTNHDQSQLTFAVWCLAPRTDFSSRFFAWISACLLEFSELQGASAFAERGRGQLPTLVARAGKPALQYRVGDQDYRVSSGAFFQVNLRLLDALAARVVAAVGPTASISVWDLYAGAGLFSRACAARGASVTAVEASALSGDDLVHNLRDFSSAKVVRQTTEQFLAGTKGAPGAIVVDPPRTGLGNSVVQSLVRIAAPTLVYLSCDPATLARDLKPLLDSGYKIVTLTLVDLFPQTFHIETLVVLRHS
jgi:23S rRNA (uracil1939-C5)-methyltransferase